MKELYIGGKKAVIDSEMYFPFTYKVSDFENFNIVGSSASKTISIPRCPENDEIFGYIAEINRITFGDNDDEIGVSFNQTKRVGYELYNDSEIVSKGIVQITDISPTEYSINLYDEIVDVIEQLSGEENEEAYLSALNIYYNGSIYNQKMSKESVSALVENNHTLIPTFNLKNFDTDTNVYINDYNGNKVVVDTGYDFTPARFNAYKNWQLDYVMPLKNIIYSINQKHNNILTYDPSLDQMLGNIHMNLGSPKPDLALKTSSFDAITLNTDKDIEINRSEYYVQESVDVSYNLKDSSVVIDKYNGLHKVYINGLKLYFSSNSPTEVVSYVSPNVINVSDLTDGLYLGAIFVDVSLSLTDSSGNIVVKSKEVKIVSEIINGASGNATVSVNGSGFATDIEVNCGDYVFDVDFYSAIRDSDILDLSLNVAFNYSIEAEYNDKNSILFYDTSEEPSNVFCNFSTTTNGSISTKSYKNFRNGDYLNGSTLFPKVSVKDFIISLVKTFNLGVKMLNNAIYLHPKEYTVETKTPQIDEITSIQVNNYDFSRLRLNSELVDSDLLSEYQDYNDKEYAEQIVNTQYTIKKTTKDLKLPYSTPLAVVDADYYAYNEFLDYKNGGFRKEMMGYTDGGNSIQFGFLKPSTNHIYLTEDTFYEAGIESDETTETIEGEKWMLANFAYKQLTSGVIEENTTDTVGYNYVSIQRWNTFSPYLYEEDGTMLQSLEVNKPLYNFANIADDVYTEDTTLYQQYLKGLITDMYSVNTHILSVKMYIEDRLDIYKIINYKNSLYRIYEVSEYDPTNKGLYDVKLIRVNSLSNYTLKDVIVYRDVYVNLSEYVLFSDDITAYEDNIDGLRGDVYKKIISSMPYEYAGNIYPKNKVFEDYLGKTRLGQSQQIHIVKKEGIDAYIKVSDLDFWHYNGQYDVKTTYSLPLVLAVDDTTSTTGDVTSDYLHTKLYVEPDTRKISNLEVNTPQITNITYSGTNTWRMFVTIKYRVDTIAGVFNEDTRIKFNQLYYSYMSVSGAFNFTQIANSAYEFNGMYLIHTFTYDVYNESAYPTTDPATPLLAFVGSTETSSYSYLIALDGTFNPSTDISVYDGRGSSNRLPILINAIYNIDNISNFTNNGSEPQSIYLDYISYTYQFTSEAIVEPGSGYGVPPTTSGLPEIIDLEDSTIDPPIEEIDNGDSFTEMLDTEIINCE